LKTEGTVYLVGAGPGDPELITVKGRRLIGECDALVYDYLVEEGMKAWVKPECELHYVGKKAGFHSMAQGDIEDLLVRLAQRGLRVVRLKGGDPFVFGRGGEEAEALKEAGIRYEVIPAVTHAVSGATLVLYMSMGRLEEICTRLVKAGRVPETPVTVVQWGTTPRQQSVRGTMEDIAWKVQEAGLGPPSIVIIGAVASFGEVLDWFDPGI
jgi:uroporphyrinogen III methyltransferase/synthase